MRKARIISQIALALAAFAFVGCSEADKEVMFDKSFSSICFSTDSITDKQLSYTDSIVTFSFAMQSPSMTEYTAMIPVMVTGMPADYDRTFSIRFDASESTAQSGVNFESIASSYTMPAGKVCTYIPVKLYRTEDIQDGYKEIRLVTMQNDEFPDLMIEEKIAVRLRVTDQLTKPSWWDAWKNWFGKYSRAKYQQWLIIYGQEALDSSGPSSGYAFSAPEIAYNLSVLREYFKENPTYDEDGELVVVPNLQQ